MSDQLHTNQYVVAFIDILGSSAAIKDDDQKSLNVVHKAYEETIKAYNAHFSKPPFVPSVKIFSDNIVIAVPYGTEQYKETAFLAVAMMSAIIQVQFMKAGWLVRGGIAAGSFFIDDMMVWGNTLVQAYHLENNVAVYPRIVIDPKLIGELNLTSPESTSHCKNWICHDKDSLFYIDFINPMLKGVDVFIIGLFRLVEKNVAKHTNNVRVCQKWLWLNSYLNEQLSMLGGEENRQHAHDEG